MTDSYDSQAHHEEQPATETVALDDTVIEFGGAGGGVVGNVTSRPVATPAVEVWLPAANGPRLPRPWDVSLYR